MSTRALLLSSSRVHGGGYLDHAEAEIKNLLRGITRVLFVPYALQDRDGYANVARAKFVAMGFGLDSIHEAGDPKRAVEQAQAMFIGGGNTFRLLKTLYELDLLDAIKQRAESGMPYVGASAGSNVAGGPIPPPHKHPHARPPPFQPKRPPPLPLNPPH